MMLLANDAISLPLALNRVNNMWVGYLFTPPEVAAALIALSLWQTNGRLRLAFRMAIPTFLATWCLLIVFVEGADTFSLISGPLKSLLLLGASVTTLLVLIRAENGSITRKDWFWICIGLALKYGSDAALEPFSRQLVGSHPELVSSAYKVKSVVDAIASLIIARGILCPIPPLRASSGPTSPASSPSPSSSPHSAPPW